MHPNPRPALLGAGFDPQGNFIHIPLGSIPQRTECFRRRVVKLFLDRRLITQRMADALLSWRHSGFSIDASIHLPATDQKGYTVQQERWMWTSVRILRVRSREEGEVAVDGMV